MLTLRDCMVSTFQFCGMISFLVALGFLQAWLNPHEAYAEGTVLLVGGCDKSGYCKVMMEDGAMGMVHYPVMGQRCRYQVEK